MLNPPGSRRSHTVAAAASRVKIPPGLPGVSCDDAWLCVSGEKKAHLFPVGRDITLCGCFGRTDAGNKSTSTPISPKGEANPNYRPYFTTCLAIQEHRWLHAYLARRKVVPLEQAHRTCS